MSRTTLNRCLKPLAILLVIILIVMLLIPRELTDAELAQIIPGMTLVEASRLLGNPRSDKAQIIYLSDYPIRHTVDFDQEWLLEGRWWKPTLSAIIPRKDVDAKSESPSTTWIGRTHLLWVEHKDGIVTKVWMFRLTRSGGGLEGFMETLREYWNKWWK